MSEKKADVSPKENGVIEEISYENFSFMEKDSGIAILTIDVKDKKVNILTSDVMQELDEILDVVAAKTSIKALVFISGKEDNFIAGANVAEIRDITDPDEGARKAGLGQAVFQKIHHLSFPVIAAIQGACVGGGLELALACHFRIAKIHPKTQIGFPEVKLGILPGFGGSQRLPRLIGIQKALPLILTGKFVDAKKAGKLGIVDKVLPLDYPFSFLRGSAEDFATEILAEYRTKDYRNRKKFGGFLTFLLEGNPLGRKFLFSQARKQALRTTHGHYPAPLKALTSVEKGICKPLEQGLAIEARLLGELVVSPECKNLISLYYLTEDIKNDPGVAKAKSEPKEIKQLGLLGAGVMGGGIAQYLAYKDIPVRMKDINQAAVNLGLQKAAELFSQIVQRKKMTEKEMEQKMSLISGTTDYTGFTQSDLVIEAVVENLDIKKKVFAEIEGEVNDETILASNTSSLSITEIAGDVKKKDRVIGFHFFNPVHRMPLVEVIRGEKTSDETTISTVAFAKRIGKIPIVVQNSPGFLVNRILGPYINEAALLLEDGAKIETIDKAMLKFGMPMGPLNLLDEVGIEVAFEVAQILQEAFGDRVAPSQVIEKLHQDGRLGKKGGKGLYLYDGKKKQVDESVYELFRDLVKPVQLSADDIQMRLVFIMLKEAIHCLEENVVRQALDVDAGMIFGTGFPPFRGGLLRYADSLGVQTCADEFNKLQEKFGERFAVPELLVKLAEKNGSFYA